MKHFFYDLFRYVEIKPNIEFILGFLGLVLAVVGLKSKEKKKKIEIEQADNDSILHIPEKYKEDVKVFYSNSETKSLFFLSIYLRNSGQTVLTKDQFHKNCSIRFGKDVVIRCLDLYTNDEFTKALATIEGSDVNLKIDLLEPKYYLKIEILYDSETKVDVKFESNIIGGERLRTDLAHYSRIEHYIGESKDANAWMPTSMILGGVSWALQIFVLENSLGIDIFDNKFNLVLPQGWFAFTFIIPLYIAYRLFRILILDKRQWNKIKDWRSL